MILRLQNATDRETTVSLALGRRMEITPTNLIEKPQQAFVISDTYQTSLHKHGIMTLLLENPAGG
jgi:alpha-mannosidase